MTEHFVPHPLSSLVPPRFNKLPYCIPEYPNTDVTDILAGYNPDDVAARPDFLNILCSRYDEDKAGSGMEEKEEEAGESAMLDLRNPSHLEGMISHTLTHSIAGLVCAGTSDTNCIPYWDRDAVAAGLAYQDPEHAETRLAVIDALSINALRTFCSYLRLLPLDYRNRIGLIDHAIGKGSRSKKDMRPIQEATKQRLEGEWAAYAGLHGGLYAAKLKHLLLLVDQQQEPATRRFMQPKLGEYARDAYELFRLSSDQLVVDMGIDTGISADSFRPPYDIIDFMQLRHRFVPGRQEQTYELPQDKCHRLSLADLLTSIDRPDHSLPFYERSGFYHLPLQFDDRAIGRNVCGHFGVIEKVSLLG